VDSIFSMVREKKDVKHFFTTNAIGTGEFWDRQMALIDEGSSKGKIVKARKSLVFWTGMLPQYEEEYYFEMNSDRTIVVMFGFTASSKFAGWAKVLNFIVKDYNDQLLKSYEDSSDDLSMEEALGEMTIEYQDFNPAICK
jgi:hypothetical protein